MKKKQNRSEVRKRNRQKAYDYMGGACVVCGYMLCTAALQFHHVLEEQKKFNISSSYSWSWKKIQSELDKCVLLCSICHTELHSGFIDKEEIFEIWKNQRNKA